MSFFENEYVRQVRFELEPNGAGEINECVVVTTSLALDPHDPDLSQRKCDDLTGFMANMIKLNPRFFTFRIVEE